MQIKTVHIAAFRNLSDFQLSLSSGVNLLYGKNGHGKTNFLESIALIINGRTPRVSRLNEIIPHNMNFARWKLGLDIEGVNYSAECIMEDGHTKKLLVNDQQTKKLPESNRGVCALTFFPEDFRILTGEPFFRRRFLDEAILLTDPHYVHLLKNFKDAYTARNSLLKNRNTNPAYYKPYEEILAGLGLDITLRRYKAISDLQNEMERISDEIFQNEIYFSLSYKPSLEKYMNSDNPKTIIAQQYDLTRDRDLAIKRTLIGPHRDDFTADFKGQDIRRFSSRGETRLSVVVLILAKYFMLKKRWDINPVVLLDDIFSELDQGRRQKVLQALPRGCQLMITAVDKDLSRKWLEGMDNISTFNVHSGNIVEDTNL